MIHFPIPIFQRKPHGFWYFVAKDLAAGGAAILLLAALYVIFF